MDKALEKINELKQQLDKLYIQYRNNEEKINRTTDEKSTFQASNKELLVNISDLEYEKRSILYAQSNLKKWKLKQIITTISLIILFESIVILGSFALTTSNVEWLFILVYSALAIPLAIKCDADMNQYNRAKKYLKTHKLEDVEKELTEKNKKLEMNYELINKLDAELANLLSTKDELSNDINFFEDLMSKIKTIRATVIEEYLKNNNELDTLINNKFDNEKIDVASAKMIVKLLKKDSNG